MSRFLKIVFGSCLGSLLAIVAIFFFFGSLIVSAISSSVAESGPSVESNSVLYLDFPARLMELTNNAEMTSFDPNASDVVGLHDLIKTIETAAEDDDIKGIYLKSGTIPASFTTVRQLRDAVLNFKKSGKFVVAYSPFYEQSAYYLATAADEVYVGPLGIIDFRGLGAEIPFYKNLLDNVGINMEVFYAGNFKSATEPFRRTGISDQNRLQTREYLSDIFGVMVADMDASRQLNGTDFRTLANDMTGWDEQASVATGMVDGVMRRTELKQHLKSLVGIDEDDQLNMISSTDYYSARSDKSIHFGNEVAVLIAEGNIVDGAGEPGSIGDKKYVKEIEQLAEDDDVKALVLRVNSGGGSASSSENIWYAIEQFKETGKPVVVSMGDLAASGGYYIAANADSVFAEPTTITGSIGVFMMFPVLKEMMNDKLGVNFDTVNITRNATALSIFQDVSPEQRRMLENRTESVYRQFMQRVADGRDIPIERVGEIAQGRVYSGMDALDLELVDRLGGLEEAIASAARLADLDEDGYHTEQYPKTLNFFEQLIADLMDTNPYGDQVSNMMLRKQLGEAGYRHFELIRASTQVDGPQAKLPVIVNF
ncbi:signal peptide peptidase SppA [Lewinellaceae bacterium SD302]|nr:signal peptide peptidase SppA [Lewinellaceae bacterium SD302]